MFQIIQLYHIEDNMKRKVLFLTFILFLQLRIWGTEFILSDSGKSILARTDSYTGVTFCFLDNYLVLFDFSRSEIFIDNEWKPLFEIQHDRDAIELSKKYGVSTVPYLDSKKKHLYIEIKDRNNEENYYCYEFFMSNNELMKIDISREHFSKIQQSLTDFWQEYPILLEDNSELQFFRKLVNVEKYEYERFFQVVQNNKIIFNFFDIIPDYEILTKPYINERKNKIVFLGCKKNESNHEDYCTVFIFSIIYDATLNDTRVRLRSEPNLSCETLGYLEKGDAVKIVDRTDEKYEIDGENWYWYQVETSDEQTGWVYGKYLDIENE